MQDEHMTISLKSAKTIATPVLPKQKRTARRMYSIFFALLVLSVVGAGGYFAFTHFMSTPTSSDKLVASSPDNTGAVIERVGKLMLLPNETPTVAVVSDLNKLKGQRFFANAEQGDVVLMYAHSAKAILYSPSLNKIIEVAPITNDQP